MTTIASLSNEIKNQLLNADAGLFANFKPGYTAYATEAEEGGYRIDYHQGEMPAYLTENFGTVEQCVAEMVKVSMDGWQEIESEE